MENIMPSTRTVIGAAPPSIKNQSENSKLLPSDVAQASQKILEMHLPINSESQLARKFKAFYPSDSFKFLLTLRHGTNRKCNLRMFKNHPTMILRNTPMQT